MNIFTWSGGACCDCGISPLPVVLLLVAQFSSIVDGSCCLLNCVVEAPNKIKMLKRERE
jgi:hypothetical protein